MNTAASYSKLEKFQRQRDIIDVFLKIDSTLLLSQACQADNIFLSESDSHQQESEVC